MNKKDYIEAVNEIKADDKLKRKTINKIKEEKKMKLKPILAGVAMLLIVTLGITSFYSINNNNGNIIATTNKDNVLPKVKNFENLYEILKLSEKNNDYLLNGMYETITKSADTAVAEDSINSSVQSEGAISDYSKTNNQVEEVDEADIVKTDGNYIYYLNDSEVIIVNVSNPNEMKIENKIEYNDDMQHFFHTEELFINNNKLIVIGEETIYNKTKFNYYDTYKTFTLAKIYNVKNKQNPVLERELEVEGNYLSSRMIDDNLYLITNKYMYLYNYYGCKIEDLNENDFKPKYKDTATSTDIQIIDFDSICYFPNSDDYSYLNIASLNINKKEKANIESYLGAGSQIYSSKNNLYIVRNNYQNDFTFIKRYSADTNIYKFELDNAKVTYKTKGSVSGTVLNQFSMDEYNGYFRIATTSNNIKDKQTNNMYVLNDNLEVVGKVEDLARGERIYSVRFMGNKAYMVTFVETDPLFVIDLSKPENPTVLGELKIPGFSTYLHPYDETHLIGIGENTEVVNYGYGEVVTTSGMKMSLFDVSDINNPKELYKVDIGEKGTYSEALYNHKAFLFSKEKNIIAFPISINRESYRVEFQGAVVYGLDLNNGFTLRGKITHREDVNMDYSNSIERIIYIGDNLFTLSNSIIKATSLETMKEISQVNINK